MTQGGLAYQIEMAVMGEQMQDEAESITVALPAGLSREETEDILRHIGWHKWKNGAELEWVCSRNCPHPSHDREEP